MHTEDTVCLGEYIQLSYCNKDYNTLYNKKIILKLLASFYDFMYFNMLVPVTSPKTGFDHYSIGSHIVNTNWFSNSSSY